MTESGNAPFSADTASVISSFPFRSLFQVSCFGIWVYSYKPVEIGGNAVEKSGFPNPAPSAVE